MEVKLVWGFWWEWRRGIFIVVGVVFFGCG